MAKRKVATPQSSRKRPKTGQAPAPTANNSLPKLPTELWFRIIRLAVKSNKGAIGFASEDAISKCRRLIRPLKACRAFYIEARKAVFEVNEISHFIRMRSPQMHWLFGTGVEWFRGEAMKPHLRRLYIMLEPQVRSNGGSYPYPNYTAGPEASRVLRAIVDGCPLLESLTVHIRYGDPRDILHWTAGDPQLRLAFQGEMDMLLQCVRQMGVREKIVMLSDQLSHPSFNKKGWCILKPDQIITGKESDMSTWPVAAVRDALLEVAQESCEHGLRLSS